MQPLDLISGGGRRGVVSVVGGQISGHLELATDRQALSVRFLKGQTFHLPVSEGGS